MSFATDVIDELMIAELHKTCCKKAMLCGLLINATVSETKAIRAQFKREDSALMAVDVLKKQFASEARLESYSRGGRKIYELSANSKAIASILRAMDNSCAELRTIVQFKCEDCAKAFIRGVFIASGTINDPQKGYQMEFSLVNSTRAKAFCDLLELKNYPPKTVNRNSKIGVYYKKNLVITDLLYYIGAVKANFYMSNVFIERDIRNIENRATNCDARNISKAVSASMKHIEAIELLEECGRLSKLNGELRYTAMLRVENPAASLSELAHLHEPPISKSGLNRRLLRILEEAEEIKATDCH